MVISEYFISLIYQCALISRCYRPCIIGDFIRHCLLCTLIPVTLFAATFPAHASNSIPPTIIRDVNAPDETRFTGFVLPYMFHTDSYEFTVGIGGGATGFQQGQAGIYGSVFTTTNSTTAGYLLGTNFQIPNNKRLFISPILSAGWYAKERDYISGNPDFPDEQSGSNDSSPDNFVESSGYDHWAEVQFDYILPIGHAQKSAINVYKVKKGILDSGATGGDTWNPAENGLSYFRINPFFRYRSFDFETETIAGSTSGIDLMMVYDNRDFPHNPSKGSVQQIKIVRDFGGISDMQTWTVIQGSFSKYFSFGATEKFRQRVIAINLWASDNVTMEKKQTPDGIVFSNRAPSYKGSSLGGFYRLRGFPSHRFNDKTAIYYSAEVRLIPDWNPLRTVYALKFFDIDWLQLVGIFEAGRVDDQWSSKTLYKDLHWDIGLGLRVMSRKVILRLDTAYSEEGLAMYVMAGQAF